MAGSQSSQTVTINRTLVGVIAIVLLVAAGILWLTAGSQNMWTGSCLKVGTVMAAFWLALPTIFHHRNWGQVSWISVIGFMATILILTGKRVDFRIVLAMLLGVAITVMFLRPRRK
jgi:hypothetical protein